MAGKLARNAIPFMGRWSKARRLRALDDLMRQGLPPVLEPALRYVIDRRADQETEAIADRIEAERARIAAHGERRVDILYSPKPGSAGEIPTAKLRPQHGQVMQFTMARVAETGKKRPWGILMHLLAREAQARNMLELGTCAGISGSYLGSVPSCEILRTIEASAALCELAREVLSVSVPRAVVINALFDEALDALLPQLDEVDFLFIDGHHEKVATIHYWQRVLPKLAEGAMVVFDDISWSQDMRECWNYLGRQPQFSHAIDLGLIGVCIHSGDSSTEPKLWDLREFTGIKTVGEPWGWMDTQSDRPLEESV